MTTEQWFDSLTAELLAQNSVQALGVLQALLLRLADP